MQEIILTQDDLNLLKKAKEIREKQKKGAKESIERQLQGKTPEERSAEMRRRRVEGHNKKKSL